MRYFMPLLFFVMYFCGPLQAQETESALTLIRVHIFSGKSAQLSSSSGNLTLSAGGASRQASGASLRIQDGTVKTDCGDLSGDRIEVQAPSGVPVAVNGKAFRGSLAVIKKKPESFMIINYVNIEDYLCGVLGGEVSASWPPEALKAQAVAARTYIAYKKQYPRDADFDVFNTTQDQVYTGIAGEHPAIVDAVRCTGGEILTSGGKPIKAFYHSTCAGYTADESDVFPGKDCVLTAVPCDYCKVSPAYSWSCEIGREELSKLLRDRKMISGEVYSIKIPRTDSSGRAVEVIFETSEGPKTMSGADFRMMVGAGKQKSTRYSLEQVRLPGQEQQVAVLISTVNPAVTASPSSVPAVSRYAPRLPERIVQVISLSHKASDMLKKYSDSSSSPASSPLKDEVRDVEVYGLFRFTGTGWGHGVGMCQWGAYGMAKEGMDYRTILQHYYKNTDITKI